MAEITQLLAEMRNGNRGAHERFFTRIYSELERLARVRVGRNSTFTVLDAPGLVHEVYLRLEQNMTIPAQDRRQFLAYASRIMRNVIIDYVRSRKAERHGGGHRRLALHTGIGNQAFAEPEIEQLGEALESLARIDERAHWVVEMRFFAGMELEEIADVLGISEATVKRDWKKARAFLLHSLRESAAP